jgi:hypothetical protein
VIINGSWVVVGFPTQQAPKTPSDTWHYSYNISNSKRLN